MNGSMPGDPRFFLHTGPHDLSTVSRVAGGLAEERHLLLDGIAPLQSAGPKHVSFISNRRYISALRETSAGAVIVSPHLQGSVPAGTAAIVTQDPYAAWARVADLFHPTAPISPGIHPQASISHGALLPESVEIGAFAAIGPGAEIGERCWIGAGAIIGNGVVIGADSRIGCQATLTHARLGNRVHIHPGARIGQEGFGFAATVDGFISIPQLGLVIIEDDVEVGANSTIDRGSTRDTIIGAGTRIDNLVQIAHNVVIGRCCVIVAQVGIAGSAIVEDLVQVGGQAAIAGHIRIGRAAQIGAQAGVISDIAPQSKVLGSPARPRTQFFRQVAKLQQMTRQS